MCRLSLALFFVFVLLVAQVVTIKDTILQKDTDPPRRSRLFCSLLVLSTTVAFFDYVHRSKHVRGVMNARVSVLT